MNRLGLGGRLILLLAVAMFAMQALALSAYLADRREAVPDRRLMPFPDQLEATVMLFDGASPEERQLLLRALGDSQVRAELSATPPDAEPGPQDMDLPGFRQRLQEVSAVLGNRELRVDVPAPEGRLPRLRALLNPERIRIAVALSDGTWLVIQRQRTLGLTLGGLPLGMLSAALAAGIAAFALIAVWVETRPLRRLGQAARRFGHSLTPEPLREAGAPDIRRLIATFNEMQDRIARADRSRTDMIAALSHDMRTPLARLTLRLRKLDPALRDAASRDIDDIARVADEAFRFAAADIATLDGAVDLRALARGLAEAAGIAVEDRQPGRPLRIAGNAALIGRALSNLIENARSYATGAVLRIEPGGARHRLIIEDDGPGIPAEDRARMLEPFQRGEASRNRASGGSGLGLALANRIVTRHGGRLLLEEAPGGGLAAIVDLPAA
ncbi:ATP-binding protein [Frigidibacter oleivorans]|uniref:ATP-binding protein n=1 Tax=Frigidibacter oleivorans TaxID=2487129 RepID=UPI001F331FF7|nr:ATP-binding protein [Frigidibacter oleivorans]